MTHQFASPLSKPLRGMWASKQGMAASLYLPINRHFISALTHRWLSLRLFLFLGEPGVIVLFAFVIIFYEERSHEPHLTDNLSAVQIQMLARRDKYLNDRAEIRGNIKFPETATRQKTQLLVNETPLITRIHGGKEATIQIIHFIEALTQILTISF